MRKVMRMQSIGNHAQQQARCTSRASHDKFVGNQCGILVIAPRHLINPLNQKEPL
jgi:hypothetical protein